MNQPFLNVDLEIVSSVPLSNVSEEFGDDVMVLYSGETSCGYMYSYELAGFDGDADSTIQRFCDLIESLSMSARKMWDDCHLKTFDIGFDSGSAADLYRATIRSDTILRVSKVGAEFAVTIYPHTKAEQWM